jgi:hypothetical protein
MPTTAARPRCPAVTATPTSSSSSSSSSDPPPEPAAMLLTERGVASTACIQLLEYCGLVSGAPKPRGPIISYITHPDHYLSCASGGYGVHTASAAAPGTTAGTRDGPPASCSSELTEDASSHSSSPVPASQPASQPATMQTQVSSSVSRHTRRSGGPPTPWITGAPCTHLPQPAEASSRVWPARRFRLRRRQLSWSPCGS